MKTPLTTLFLWLIASPFALFAQSSPVFDIMINDTYINNKVGKQHFQSPESIQLQEPKIYLRAATKGKVQQYGAIVIDFNRDGKIVPREFLTRLVAADEKGRFEFSVELSEKILAQIQNYNNEPPLMQFRVSDDKEALLATPLYDKNLASILWAIGESQPIISQLTINETTVKNEKDQQHAEADEIVIIDGDFVSLEVVTRAENPGKLFGTLVIDLNGDGKIEPSEILSEPFLANENGTFRKELKLDKKTIEKLYQLKEPQLIQFRISENPEALYDRVRSPSEYSSLSLKAIGPVIVVDTSQGDQSVGETACLPTSSTTIKVSLTNFLPRTMRVEDIKTSNIPTTPSFINPTLPNFIYSFTDETTVLNYPASIHTYFDTSQLCFLLPIDITYSKIEEVQFILVDGHIPTWDTIYSGPYNYVDTFTLCYCLPDDFGENEEGKSRSGSAIIPNNTINKTSNWQVFPNPVAEELTLNYNLAKKSEVSIFISNLNGQIVKTVQQTNTQEAGEYQRKVEVSDLESGVYMVSLVSNAGTQFKKIIKN